MSTCAIRLNEHSTLANMIFIFLFILFFIYVFQMYYSQPGFCTNPYPLFISFWGKALRYHFSENPQGIPPRTTLFSSQKWKLFTNITAVILVFIDIQSMQRSREFFFSSSNGLNRKAYFFITKFAKARSRRSSFSEFFPYSILFFNPFIPTRARTLST